MNGRSLQASVLFNGLVGIFRDDHQRLTRQAYKNEQDNRTWTNQTGDKKNTKNKKTKPNNNNNNKQTNEQTNKQKTKQKKKQKQKQNKKPERRRINRRHLRDNRPTKTSR